MSLVGSLEDIGLGDILQIVGLSQKSGVLLLTSEGGEGRILFRKGLVQGARVDGEPADLRELLVGGERASAEAFDRAVESARREGTPLRAAVASCAGLSEGEIDALLCELAERSILRMFGWPRGEFHFEVREFDAAEQELELREALDTPSLTARASRPEGGETEVAPPQRSPGPEERDAVAVASETPAATPEPPEPAATEVRDAVPEPPAPAAPTEAAARPAAPADLPPALIVIDPELPVLEWIKAALAPLFPRIHIFQRPEGGVTRVRQYLGRGQVPAVLLSSATPSDPLTGARNADELVARLRGLAAPMAIFRAEPDGAEAAAPAGADAVVCTPRSHELANRSSWSRLEASAERLSAAFSAHFSGAPESGGSDAVAAETPGDEDLHRLKKLSAALRGPEARGEVLSQVLEFAAESFSRVAIFMLREELAVGVAQLGLAAEGASESTFFTGSAVPSTEGCLAAVLAKGSPFRGELAAEENDALIALLGGAAPEAAYVAPIESDGQVVAVLYGDNAPGSRPLPDTTLLEIALHDASLALDRALFERMVAVGETDEG